jgi:polar amino acid transport system substrate-binding protein
MKDVFTTRLTQLFTTGLLAFGLAFTMQVKANDFSQLTIMTENFPPFNYKQDGKAAGSAVELLTQASAAVGKPITNDKINVMTWARAYKAVQSGPNALLFSMTRTESREDLFKWAGPIGENRVVIWTKKSSGIAPFDNIKDNSETVSVVRDTVGDQLMMTAGAVDGDLKRTSKPEAAAKMLINDRVKLWAYSENSGAQQLELAGANIDDYEVVHVLKTSQLYFAFSKDVDDSVIQLLQKGIDQVRK